MTSTFTKLAAALACSVALNVALPVASPTLGLVTAAEASETSHFRSVLARYGSFQAHARYGEVWVPSQATVPVGWHPYPACYWVYSKDLGWYFDDRTEWGRIVHHYGRWAHDADLGWVWVHGEEFSPGWVVWRTSDKWVGWAPLPPDQDVKEISADAFNNDKHWIFMDARRFGTKCLGGTGLVSASPVVFETTKLVTEIRFVHGIAVFVLPAPLIVNIVDIDIFVFNPWSPCFFGAWFWNWNWVMNNIIININLPGPHCPVQKKVPDLSPIKNTPPPAPGFNPPVKPPFNPGKQTDNTPNGGGTRKPLDPPKTVTPDHPGRPPVVVPQPPIKIVDPILPKFPRPDFPIKPDRPDRTPGGGSTSGGSGPNGHNPGGNSGKGPSLVNPNGKGPTLTGPINRVPSTGQGTKIGDSIKRSLPNPDKQLVKRHVPSNLKSSSMSATSKISSVPSRVNKH